MVNSDKQSRDYTIKLVKYGEKAVNVKEEREFGNIRTFECGQEAGQAGSPAHVSIGAYALRRLGREERQRQQHWMHRVIPDITFYV